MRTGELVIGYWILIILKSSISNLQWRFLAETRCNRQKMWVTASAPTRSSPGHRWRFAFLADCVIIADATVA
jgi:hypothetical protein